MSEIRPTGVDPGPDEIAEDAPGGRTFFWLRLAQYAVMFGTGILAARALGPSGRAEYLVPLALAAVIWSVCHLTVSEAAGRLLARREETLRDLVGALSLFTLVLGILAVFVTVGVAEILGSDLVGGASSTSVWFAALTIPPLLTSQMAGDTLLRLGGLRFYGWAALGGSLLQLAIVTVLVAQDELTPELALAAAAIGAAGMAIPLAVGLGRVAGASSLYPTWRPRLKRRMLSIGLALHPATISLQLGARIDLIVVGAIVSTSDTGLYSLALTLGEALFLATRTMALTALPVQTKAGESAAIRYTHQFARRCLKYGALFALIGIVAAYPFITVVYGEAWEGSVVPFMILALAGISFAVETPVRQLLVRIAPPSLLSRLAVAGLLVNVALTIILANAFGIAGAAAASVVANWGYTAALYLRFRRYADERAEDPVPALG
jgi:O-antigen/teichoic acid export membrane protein